MYFKKQKKEAVLIEKLAPWNFYETIQVSNTINEHHHYIYAHKTLHIQRKAHWKHKLSTETTQTKLRNFAFALHAITSIRISVLLFQLPYRLVSLASLLENYVAYSVLSLLFNISSCKPPPHPISLIHIPIMVELSLKPSFAVHHVHWLWH